MKQNGYVLITDLLNVEKTTASADIGFPQILCSVNDGRTNGESNTIIVRFSYSANRRDIMLHKEVLGDV